MRFLGNLDQTLNLRYPGYWITVARSTVLRNISAPAGTVAGTWPRLGMAPAGSEALVEGSEAVGIEVLAGEVLVVFSGNLGARLGVGQ